MIIKKINLIQMEVPENYNSYLLFTIHKGLNLSVLQSQLR